MTKQIFGRDTVTGECGWFTPVADAPDLFITNATVAGDIITLTRSDGVQFPVEITHPAIPAGETEQLNFDASVRPVVNLDTEVIVFQRIADVSGETSLLNVDISGLIAALTSTPHPAIIAGDNITITGNDVDGYTINSTDPTVDTDTFGTVTTVGGVTTINFPDGTSYTPTAPTPFDCDDLKSLLNDVDCVPTIDTCDDDGDIFNAGEVEFLARRIVGGVAQVEAVNLDDIYAERLNTLTFSQNFTAADFGTITENAGANRLDYLTNPAHDVAIPAIEIPEGQCRCTDTHVQMDASAIVTINDSDGDNNATINLESRMVYDGPAPSRAPVSSTQAGVNTDQDDQDRNTREGNNSWLVPIQRDAATGVCSVGPFRAQFRSNSSGGVSNVTNYILGVKLSGVLSKRIA